MGQPEVARMTSPSNHEQASDGKPLSHDQSNAAAALARLIEQIPLGIQVFNRAGLCTNCNQAHLNIFGLSGRDELVGVYNILNDPLAQEYGTAAAFRRALDGETTFLGDIDFDFTRADPRFARGASRHTVEVTIFPVSDEYGVVNTVVGMNNDVTERKQVEAELLENKRFIEHIANTSPHVTYVYDHLDQRTVYQSRDIALILGYPPEQIEKMGSGRLRYIMEPSDLERLRGLRRVFADKLDQPALEFVARLKHASGKIGWFHMREIVFLRNQHSVVQQTIGTIQDISDLYQALEELRASKIELEARVAERTAELEAAYEDLTRLDKMKSRFVSDVSHELRNPLTNLTMRLHLLEHDSPTKQPEHLRAMKSQMEALNQVVEDILQLSRLEISKNRVDFEDVNLNAIALQAVNAYLPRAEASHLHLHVNLAEALPQVAGVYNFLSQMIGNLVANAINYTTTGEIWVRTYLDGNSHGVYFQIQDTGIGIDQEDLDHIFERFYRGRAARQSQLHGTGLGLGIVKDIVDLHQGTIQIESQRFQGTTVTVWLPVASPNDHSARPTV